MRREIELSFGFLWNHFENVLKIWLKEGREWKEDGGGVFKNLLNFWQYDLNYDMVIIAAGPIRRLNFFMIGLKFSNSFEKS